MSWLPFDPQLCWQVTLTLLHVSWIGFVVGLVVVSANHALRNIPAQRRYVLNFASLLIFAASLPVTFAVVRGMTTEITAIPVIAKNSGADPVISTHAVTDHPRAAADVTAIAPDESQLVPSDAAISETVTAMSIMIQSMLSLRNRLHRFCQDVAPIVSGFYTLGVVFMFVKLALCIRVNRQILSASEPITDDSVLAGLAKQAGLLALRFSPIVALCEHIAVPVVVGLLRPMILVPPAIVNNLTLEQLESVLIHELAHLHRYDHVMIVVQRVLEAILFFHPVTWYLSHRLQDDRETSCDDLVLSIGWDRLLYAQSLLRVAELRIASPVHQEPIAVAADGQRPSKLRQRIARLLGDSESDSVRVSSHLPVLVLAGVITAGIFTASTADPPADHERSELAVQIDRVGEVVMQNLHRHEIDYLNESQREQLVSELKERLQSRVSTPLPSRDFDAVLSAISRFFSDSHGTEFKRFHSQADFAKHFATLHWRIWVGMDPVKLTADELERREKQREWFRGYIVARHADDQKPVMFVSKAGNSFEMTPCQYDLFMFEELLSDPTYPFLHFPLSEEQFHRTSESLESAQDKPWFSKMIYDEYEVCLYGRVANRWRIAEGHGNGILYDSFGFLDGVYDLSLADRIESATSPQKRELENNQGNHPVRLTMPRDRLRNVVKSPISSELDAEQIVTDGNAPPIQSDQTGVTDVAVRADPVFRCTVIESDGKPIKGAMLVWRGGGLHTTNENGFVQVPKVFRGPLEFTIFSPDWAPVTAKVSIPQPSPVAVVMQRGKRVEFRAVDLQGKPIEGIRFYPEWPRMAAPSPDQSRMLPINLDVLRDILNFRTNADGLFVWENAPDLKLGYRIASGRYLSPAGGNYGPEGSPHTLVFRPVIPVSMTVLDAANGRPIADARITPGTHFKSNPAGSWYWDFDAKRSNSKGRLETSLRSMDRVVQFRIQADGYRPVVSEEFDAASLPDSPIALQIRLDADSRFSGTALQPDGRPAAGAMIYTKCENKLNSSKDIQIANGVVDESKITSATTADVSGEFQIPPHAEPFECLIVHDSGYLKLMDAELLKQTEFSLLPWASVKGELWLRGVPAANTSVQLRKSGFYLGEETSLPHIDFSQRVRTDASGTFSFPKCMAGEWDRTIIYDDTITEKNLGVTRFQHYDCVRLIPGEERYEIIGRDGADVIGRVMLPTDPEIVISECDIYVDNVDARRLNGNRPSSTNSAKLGADGSFHLFNLEPATHEIELFIRVSGERDSEVRYSKKIVITPDRFVGRSSTNPIELGEIQVEPVE